MKVAVPVTEKGYLEGHIITGSGKPAASFLNIPTSRGDTAYYTAL
jgi:hypothetical protein